MIYLIHGTDKEKARAKSRSLADSLLAKKPDATHGRFNSDTFSMEALDELIGGQGLFVARLIVELDNLVSGDSPKKAELKELILGTLDRLGVSENIFIFLEAKLLKGELVKFEKHAEKIQEYTLPEQGMGGSKPSPFALADALGKRDKKILWKLYVEQVAGGTVAEELHGLLFWQIKSMLLASSAPSASAAGLKPFVYGKAKQFSVNFSTEELQALSRRFISIYHDAHRGVAELSLLLEQAILEL
jgi:DNA polymerase III delta subunit